MFFIEIMEDYNFVEFSPGFHSFERFGVTFLYRTDGHKSDRP